MSGAEIREASFVADAQEASYTVDLLHERIRYRGPAVLLDGAPWKLATSGLAWPAHYPRCRIQHIVVLDVDDDVALKRARGRWQSGERREAP